MSEPKTYLIPVRAELGSNNKTRSDWRTTEPTARELLSFIDKARIEVISLEAELESQRKLLLECKRELHMQKNQSNELRRELERMKKLSNDHVSVAQKLAVATAMTPTVIVKKVRVAKREQSE